MSRPLRPKSHLQDDLAERGALDDHVRPALTLIPVTSKMRQAFGRSRAELSCYLQLDLPDGWPEFPEAFEPSTRQPDVPWIGYIFVAEGGIVGNGGFTGPPDRDGVVEIGYEIAPEHRNQGHATRAAEKLISLAFCSGAKRVIAHSLAAPNASNAVMAKVGMRYVATRLNAEVGSTWRYAIDAFVEAVSVPRS